MSGRTEMSGGIPPAAIKGGVALVIGTMLLAALARPRPQSEPAWVASRSLVFVDQPDGGVAVNDGASGDAVAVIPPGDGGFVRGALRGLARERARFGIGPGEPFVLGLAPGGRLVLTDPSTRAHIELAAFGPTNADAFRAFLPGQAP